MNADEFWRQVRELVGPDFVEIESAYPEHGPPVHTLTWADVEISADTKADLVRKLRERVA